MKPFALFFGFLWVLIIIRGYFGMKKDLKRLSQELSIDDNHPLNQSLWEFVFLNRFRFWTLLFVIFYTGLMLYITLL